MSIDIFFHNGIDNKQEFEWFGLRFAEKLVDVYSFNYINRMLDNVGGYEFHEEYDSQKLQIFALYLKANVVRVANWVEKLGDSKKSLVMQAEESEGIKEKISFLVIKNGRKEILKENLLKFENFDGTRFVGSYEISSGLVALGRMDNFNENYTPESLKKHAALIYHNGILLFNYLMSRGKRGKSMSNDQFDGPESYVEWNGADEPAA